MKRLLTTSLITLTLVAGTALAHDPDAVCAAWKDYAYDIHMARSEGVSITEAMPRARAHSDVAAQVVTDAYDDMPVTVITASSRQHDYAERFSERVAVRCYRSME